MCRSVLGFVTRRTLLATLVEVLLAVVAVVAVVAAVVVVVVVMTVVAVTVAAVVPTQLLQFTFHYVIAVFNFSIVICH